MKDTDHNKNVIESIDENVVDYKESISGQMFGSLKAIRPHSRDAKRCLKYLCECTCGKLTTPYKHLLKSGKVKSCGCANKPVNVGDTFGRLTVLSESETKLTYCRSAVYNCLCSCGNTLEVRSLSLVQGNTKSCGCLAHEHVSQLNKKHGDSPTNFYKVWSTMKARCLNPKSKHYEDYGGRGITVSDSWLEYTNFKEDMFDTYTEGMLLDRINTNDGYCKENCRWVTDQISVWNRRRNKNNTSGRTGVVWREEVNKWVAQISIGSKPNNVGVYLGCFESFDDAVEARELAEIFYRGEIKDYEQ